MFKLFGNLWNTVTTPIISVVENVTKPIVDVAEAVIDTTVDAATDVVSDVTHAVLDPLGLQGVSSVVDAAATYVDEGVDFVTDVAQTTVDGAKDAITWSQGGIEAIVSLDVRAIADEVSEFLGQAEVLADNLINNDFFEFVADVVTTNSEIASNNGEGFIAELADLIINTTNTVDIAAYDVAADLETFIGDTLFDTINDWVDDLITA
ncbi:hypothetical protein F8A10_08380 [Paracoccus kondratievae]|uniref:hypothetical protein n=1 Tax=Paracoccus kondratievae TaxID=135740 RepID=UPI00126627B4|nr:hypothetical protein [Paracoccus kondratievae]QFQ87441.1 hypothetical protein F8A10_08380 [Paracoccus kondratievae]